MYNAERSGTVLNFFKTPYKAHNETTVISSRYHTSQTEFKVMARPNTPVNPHKNTAACNRSNAPFMRSKKQTFYTSSVAWQQNYVYPSLSILQFALPLIVHVSFRSLPLLFFAPIFIAELLYGTCYQHPALI